MTCEQDTRVPAHGRVCLKERPSHVYYMQALTHAHNNTIRYPPGMDNLLTAEGFKGLTLEDFVRSSLFQDEVWRSTFKLPGEPDAEVMLEEAALKDPKHKTRTNLDDDIHNLDQYSWYVDPNNEDDTSMKTTNINNTDVTTILEHYGDIPGAVLLPVCRSWLGQALSAINSDDDSNAPCLCDPPARSLATKWKHPSNWTMAYTKRFIKDSLLYKMEGYGKMCKHHNGCHETEERWGNLLNLTAEEMNSTAKSMKIAWESCHHHH
jgi:hypothetical protein